MLVWVILTGDGYQPGAHQRVGPLCRRSARASPPSVNDNALRANHNRPTLVTVVEPPLCGKGHASKRLRIVGTLASSPVTGSTRPVVGRPLSTSVRARIDRALTKCGAAVRRGPLLD